MVLGYLWQCLELWDLGSFTYRVVFPLWGVGEKEEEKDSVSFPAGASGGRVELCRGVFAWGHINLFVSIRVAFICKAP